MSHATFDSSATHPVCKYEWVVVTTLAALLLMQVMDIPFAQSFLAYAPGGLTEMALLTLAIGQDVAFVSVIHIVRITAVVGVASPLFRIWQRR